MNQPEHIVRTLDRYLSKATNLHLYGRAALALGYSSPRPAFNATMDVDAILPEVNMAAIESDESFWNAIEHTNDALETSGLYITHLFSDSQIIISHDWLNRTAPIQLIDLTFLRLFRPSTEDLILTKMMRIDPQDREDIDFLSQQADFDLSKLNQSLLNPHIPDIPEIQHAYSENMIWVKNLLG